MVTIEREGYKVKGIVYMASGSPYGLRANPEAVVDETWIHDEQGFRDAHGMEPTEKNLSIVVSKEIDAIRDDLIDAAREDY